MVNFMDDGGLSKFVEVCAKGLANFPDEVKIEKLSFTGVNLCLMVHTNPDDVSLIIGREGRNIRNLRELCWAIASKNKLKVTLIVKE